MTNNISEFKGSTKEAIMDIKQDIRDLTSKVESLSRKYWILMILLSLIAIEKLPDVIKLALAR